VAAGELVGPQVGHLLEGVAIHHATAHGAVLLEDGVIGVIDGSQFVPQGHKAAHHLVALPQWGVIVGFRQHDAQDALDGLAHRLVGDVVGVDVAVAVEVLEKLVGVDVVHVDVLEVDEQDVAPLDEVLEAGGDALALVVDHLAAVSEVEGKQALDGGGRHQVGEVGDEGVDGDDLRHEGGGLQLVLQLALKELAGAAVGENEAQVFQLVGIEMLHIVAGDLAQERGRRGGSGSGGGGGLWHEQRGLMVTPRGTVAGRGGGVNGGDARRGARARG